MKTWHVTCGGSTWTVSAHHGAVNAAGALVFTDAQGVLTQSYAPGKWSSCILDVPAAKNGSVPRGY